MDMNNIPVTADNIMIALGVVLGVCALIVAVGAAADRIKKWRHPEKDRMAALEQRMAKLEGFLANDKVRLDKHEEQIEILKQGQRLNLQGMQAMLEHELHNGNSDQMQKAADDMNAWLLNK